MGELINGRTPEEIKTALRLCNTVGNNCCKCPYNNTCLNHPPEIDAIALIEHLEAKQPKWISVNEQLPVNEKNDPSYLVYMADCDGYIISDYFVEGEWLANADLDNITRFVTHWMPIPEPPKEEIG